MASLKALQKKVPGAHTVAGRVVGLVDRIQVDLGAYVGEDSVVLNQLGEELMAPPKKEEKKPVFPKGFDLDDLEV